MITVQNLGFPFTIHAMGKINATDGDEIIRGKIIQVLFTVPGERINLPDFGCGLFNLVFEPNNAVLVAATEFTMGQALGRWLAEEIMAEGGKAKKGQTGYFRNPPLDSEPQPVLAA